MSIETDADLTENSVMPTKTDVKSSEADSQCQIKPNLLMVMQLKKIN